MATAVQIYKDFFDAVSRREFRVAWRALSRVPDCPQCKGSGSPCDGFSDFVYWRGQQYEVCATCKGAGKG